MLLEEETQVTLICNQRRGTNQGSVSATQSVALPPIIEGAHIFLSFLLLVHVLYSYISMEVKSNKFIIKPFIYAQKNNLNSCFFVKE